MSCSMASRRAGRMLRMTRDSASDLDDPVLRPIGRNDLASSRSPHFVMLADIFQRSLQSAILYGTPIR